ncbi:DUF3616 domain-containing protein [Variovorax sp. KK3]|uniref:DUF3616 domain-containing protein n=1 Tax=Variovorax sp. KK3 TaxID=1855728 RepID=UPI00097BD0F3|nr:DUF3616 domain-containing protein [Variovorax sp. KK3]
MAPAPIAFKPLSGLYEPSAIRQLPDGRFIVVEDEAAHPFSLATIDPDGSVRTHELTPTLFQTFSDFWKLDDLEGMALDRSGLIYAITSHSRDDDGKKRRSRDKLVRFRVEGDRVVDPCVADDLKQAIVGAHPMLAAAAEIRDVKEGGGLNIEGLEFARDRKQLLIGFRGPLHDGRAIVARLENPAGVFDAGETPRIASDLAELVMGGHGIRGLSFIPSIDAYLVIGGPMSPASDPFSLWRWDGQRGTPATRVTVQGLASFERAEGVCAAMIDGVEQIVVVSDDGDRKSGRCASYVAFGADQLIAA